MVFQLFRDSCLTETKIGWMVTFAKLLNQDCVQMFFILMTSRVMTDADTKWFRQALDHRHCLHPLLPKQRPKNCCPPSEVADTVTHCHIFNFHYAKTPLWTDVCLLRFNYCLCLSTYIMRLYVYFCVFYVFSIITFSIVHLCALDTRSIKCNLLATCLHGYISRSLLPCEYGRLDSLVSLGDQTANVLLRGNSVREMVTAIHLPTFTQATPHWDLQCNSFGPGRVPKRYDSCCWG